MLTPLVSIPDTPGTNSVLTPDTVDLSSPVGAPAPSPTAAPAVAPQPPSAAFPREEEDVNEECDGSCMQRAECRKDHICAGNHCRSVRGVAQVHAAHRVSRSGFGETLGGKRHIGCKLGNEARKAKPGYADRNANIVAERALKRAEKASIGGFDVLAAAPQEIALAKAAYERSITRFGGKDVDVYVFGASTGSGERFSLKNESVSSIFIQTNTNNPILRSSKWSAKGSGECLVPTADRLSINDSDHVFEMADAGRGDSGKELSHLIEKALHIFGEQHAAASGGRIKTLWRGHGKGYPKGLGPYKVGLLVIERDAAGRLPFGWKRTDGK